jgi:short-subunit dehydrogenase
VPSKIRTALITGGSAGIGYELAKRFAREGYALVLVARDDEALARVANQLSGQCKTTPRVIAKDLALPPSPQELYSALQQEEIEVDVLVNNAGFGVMGPFASTSLERELAMMQLHMASLTHLTKLFLRPMLARGRGKILNVASTAAFQPGPFMAVYYASKAYVLSFSEALASEVRGSGVTVSVLCPGATRTEFHRRVGIAPLAIFNRMAMDAAGVAAAGYAGLERGQTVIIPGFTNKFLALCARVMPRRLVAAGIRKLQEKRF